MARGVFHERVETFRAEGGAIGAGVFVVWGTAEDQVTLPGSADIGTTVGITITAAAAAGDPIQVCTRGVADLVVNAASPNITRGAPIGIHGTTGRGKLSALGNGAFAVGKAREAATADAVTIAVELVYGTTSAS